MAFRVNFADDRETSVQGSDFDTYYFLSDGVLKVDVGEETFYYSPAYWQSVAPSRGHLPGLRQIPGGNGEWFASGPTI
ncbi:hypothetical protein [Mycolicibacterium thermoresistibile]